MTDFDPALTNPPQRLVFVTGPAGAGRTSAVRVLEDLGYEAIDNPPLVLVPDLISGGGQALALAIDTRTRGFSVAALNKLLDEIDERSDLQAELLYLDCSVDVLLRRYSETRRRHPLAPDESPITGIQRDLDILGPIRLRADALINTSEMSVHDLRAEVSRLFMRESGTRLGLSFTSFSYKRGLPRGADMVFDCRFLKNPYWNPALRSLNGTDEAVQDYIAEDSRLNSFFDQVRSLLDLVLPAAVEEGKAHFSVAFGCTGGQHRSVALAERMAKALAGAGWRVSIQHREIERRQASLLPEKTGTNG